jgi:predicted nuclease of predicted toxin-antitoxin system
MILYQLLEANTDEEMEVDVKDICSSHTVFQNTVKEAMYSDFVDCEVVNYAVSDDMMIIYISGVDEVLDEYVKEIL